MAQFTRNGYGQVEPNQLSAQKTGQIYASLPLDANVQVLQNGEFMYYDYKSGTVTADATVGEPMLVFNEIKLYEPFWQTSYKDFAMIRVGDNYVTSRLATEAYGENSDKNQAATINPSHTEYGYRMDGIAPRLVKTNIGDIYTTNMVATGDSVEYAVGDVLKLIKTDRNTLELSKDGDIDAIQFAVTKVYTMPDGQPGLKVQRIK
jgi:hypothetical protein